MSLHLQLAEALERDHADQLAAPPQLTQDALSLVLANGVLLTVRYAAPDAYSLRWRTSLAEDAAELGIDTAPTHPQLSTAPNHLHRADGQVVADPLTRPDTDPAANLAALLDALLTDPLLTELAGP